MGKREAIDKEMVDEGMLSAEDWREAVSTQEPGVIKRSANDAAKVRSRKDELRGHEQEEIPDFRVFTPLFFYLDGGFRDPDQQKTERYRTTDDHMDRLSLFRDMSPSDAVAAFFNYSDNDRGKRYLAHRLDFYQKLFQGTATRKVTEHAQTFDEKSGQMVDVETTKEELISTYGITPETVKRGLLRDTMFAEMTGTPELGVYKLAEKFCKTRNLGTTHFPPLKGYPGDQYGREGTIGAYKVLEKLYEQARHEVTKKQEAGDAEDPQKTEHRAVLTAARWLSEAMDYSPAGRGPNSPYVAKIEEAIAWARLGGSVKRQMRGMRQKIQGVDLHNIGRFIGKSGDGPHNLKRRKNVLSSEIRALDSAGRDTNDAGISRETLEQELAQVNERFEKGKSLAAKALDLHFHFNQAKKINRGEYEQNVHADTIDWINNAPLGTIKRAHRMMRNGMTDEEVLQLALTDIVMGKSGMDRDDFEKIGELFAPIQVARKELTAAEAAREALGSDDEERYAHPEYNEVNETVREASSRLWATRGSIKNLAEIGTVLSRHGYDIPLAEKVEMSKLQTYGLDQALSVFSLEEAKTLMGRYVNLEAATNAKKRLREVVNQDVSLDVIARVVEVPAGVEALVKCIEAGFTLEELLRFPFLISSLIDVDAEKIL